MIHNPEEGALERVEGAICAFPKRFSNQIQIQVVTGGKRSTPLNQAISLARGDYFVSLDDDDLVFGNWVELFKTAATSNPENVLRVQCLSQRWEILDEHDAATSAIGPVTAEYPAVFNVVAHLSNNYTPNMSAAFPLSLVRAAKIDYDEDLETAEDWDFFMRVIAAGQITNVPHPSAIYRKWSNAKTSIQDHDLELWSRNRELIMNKIRLLSFTIPAHEIIGRHGREQKTPRPSFPMVLKVAKLAFSFEVWKLAMHYRIPHQLLSRRVTLSSLISQLYRRISGPASGD
jgi:hypothetical protein